MKPILNPNYGLYRKDDCAVCDSLQIAEMFGKRHAHILRIIQLVTALQNEEFIKTNFIKTSYLDTSGKRNTKYLVTKVGFDMIVMAFETTKIRQFNEVYVNRFSDMAGFIRALYDIKKDFIEFTEAVKLSHEIPLAD